MRSRRSLSSAIALLALTLSSVALHAGADEHLPGPTPRAKCGPDDNPETDMQGRVPRSEVDSGRAAEGYTCNTEEVARFGNTNFPGGAGGYKVFRYVDREGRRCAYYDSTLLIPLNALSAGTDLVGVYVLDMTDPENPVKTANLVTPAMLSPHESLSLNEERGLLAAVMGTPVFAPGIVDVYDISEDCRYPVLRSSTPLGILGHEGSFSPDGNTYWVTSTGGNTVTAVDVSEPLLPRIVWTGRYNFHGISVSDDGTRLYAADLGSPSGLTILDVSEVQDRVSSPTVSVISRLTWPNVSIPQTTIPVTIDGHPYLIEVDEFARGTQAGNPNAPVGAARIIDIADETAPRVVSDIRLEVHQPENIAQIAGDAGATFQVQGYAAHYCSVPQREEPGVLACSFILSGMRLFDIRDPFEPKEIAYFNGPIPQTDGAGRPGSAHAMSAPAVVPERGEIWYSDGNLGFFVVGITNDVWPF